MRKRELLERIEWLEARESEHSQIVYDMQQRIEGLELHLAVLGINTSAWPPPPPVCAVRCSNEGP